MDKRELSFGYKIIRKPHPEKSLKMQERFILTADLDSAEIYPEVWFKLFSNIMDWTVMLSDEFNWTRDCCVFFNVHKYHLNVLSHPERLQFS